MSQLIKPESSPITRKNIPRLYVGLSDEQSGIYDRLLGRNSYGEGSPLSNAERVTMKELWRVHATVSALQQGINRR